MLDDELAMSISAKQDSFYLNFLNLGVRCAIRVLAVLMVLVIQFGVADVCWVMYTKFMSPPKYLLQMSDLLNLFSAFLAVLIAIEIFVNIIIYLKDRVIHVRLVVATALMAMARKIIGFDYDSIEPTYVIASAAAVLALGITYWLLAPERIHVQKDQESGVK